MMMDSMIFTIQRRDNVKLVASVQVYELNMQVKFRVTYLVPTPIEVLDMTFS